MKCLQPTSRGTNFNHIPHYNLFYVMCLWVFVHLSLRVSLSFFISLNVFLYVPFFVFVSLFTSCVFFFPFVCASLCVLLYLYVSIPMPLSMSLNEHVRLALFTNHAKTLLHAKGNCVWEIIDHISFSSYVLL